MLRCDWGGGGVKGNRDVVLVPAVQTRLHTILNYILQTIQLVNRQVLLAKKYN